MQMTTPTKYRASVNSTCYSSCHERPYQTNIEHHGNFQCVATNICGSSESSYATVTVTSKHISYVI